jgi:hypothetical protein
MIVVLRRLLASLTQDQRRAALALGAGSLLALVPVLAVVPAPRLLGIPALGIAVIVALVIDRAWFAAADRLSFCLATLFAFLHLVHAPVASYIAGYHLRLSSLFNQRTVRALGGHLPDLPHAEVVLVRGGSGLFFGPFALSEDGTLPGYWRILSHTGHVLALRKDERTLELKVPPGESIYPIGPGSLYRSESAPLQVGQIIDTPGMRVEVLDSGARFTFEARLEEPPRYWAQEGFEGFVDVTLPEPGFGAPIDP